ncbi:MAG: hypothetical protein ACSHWW_06080 [Nonlabens sp.]|uniref:hypothetical protein n=1 Tax=Nonlabens sp. TaxID=1888209 RepID=UPI003EF441BE
MSLVANIKKWDIWNDKRYFLLKDKRSKPVIGSPLLTALMAIVVVFYFWHDMDITKMVLVYVGINALFTIYDKMTYEEPYNIEEFIVQIDDENEKYKWWQILMRFTSPAIILFMAVYFYYLTYERWLNDEIGSYEIWIYIIPVIVFIISLLAPSRPIRLIYFQGGFLKFTHQSITFYERIDRFQEIRISNEMISMKSTTGKVDRLFGYDWTDSQMEQFKAFINKKAPQIEVLILE